MNTVQTFDDGSTGLAASTIGCRCDQLLGTVYPFSVAVSLVRIEVPSEAGGICSSLRFSVANWPRFSGCQETLARPKSSTTPKEQQNERPIRRAVYSAQSSTTVRSVNSGAPSKISIMVALTA